MRTAVDLDEARAAVGELTERLTRLLRSVPDPSARAVGTWTVADVAAHLAHVVDLDLASARGGGAESVLEARDIPPPADVEALADLTATMLQRDPVRDPKVHADRIDEGIAAVLDACDEPDELVPWLLGTTLRRSAICGHLLYEMLLHGGDIARGARVGWRIPPELARLAIEGFVAPVLDDLSPDGAGDLESTASCEIRVRGGGRFVLALTDGGVAVHPSLGGVDLRVCGEPAALLLALSGRREGRLVDVLTGRLAAWGPRPWRGVRVLDALRSP